MKVAFVVVVLVGQVPSHNQQREFLLGVDRARQQAAERLSKRREDTKRRAAAWDKKASQAMQQIPVVWQRIDWTTSQQKRIAQYAEKETITGERLAAIATPQQLGPILVDFANQVEGLEGELENLVTQINNAEKEFDRELEREAGTAQRKLDQEKRKVENLQASLARESDRLETLRAEKRIVEDNLKRANKLGGEMLGAGITLEEAVKRREKEIEDLEESRDGYQMAALIEGIVILGMIGAVMGTIVFRR